MLEGEGHAQDEVVALMPFLTLEPSRESSVTAGCCLEFVGVSPDASASLVLLNTQSGESLRISTWRTDHDRYRVTVDKVDKNGSAAILADYVRA